MGTVLGVIGNLWASVFMKVMEEYHVEFKPETWMVLLILLSVILFIYGVGLALLGSKGYRFLFKSS